MEKTIQIQSGKYIFQIEENTQMRDEDILYTAIKIGGNYLDCVSIFINYNNNKPLNANMPHPEKCAITHLDKGDGSRIMIKTILEYIKQNYPTIKEIKYDDMSSIECATDEELSQATNRKRGTHLHLCTIKTPTLSAVMSEQGVADCAFQMRNGVKPMSLYNLSIAYNGQTWYEKYFGAKKVKKHEKYRERVTTLLQTKPPHFNDFLKITRAPEKLWDELFKFYEGAKTYSDFFHSIPKPERCQLLRPWIDEFMKHYLDDVFSNSGWIIPMSINGGGKPRRQTRKRMPTFYVPDGVRLTTNYQMNLGISVNDV